MSKKILSVVGIVTIALLVGGVVWYFKKQARQEVSVQSIRQEQESSHTSDINVSNWKTYKNNEIGYEFKYPLTFTVHETNDEINFKKDYGVPDGSVVLYRYITLESSDNDFAINIGVKKKNENVEVRAWRTGVPAGDFTSLKTIKIDGSDVSQRGLLYQGKINEHVWYCALNSGINKCEDFALNNEKVGFVEVLFIGDIDPVSSRWDSLDADVNSILSTLHAF